MKKKLPIILLQCLLCWQMQVSGSTVLTVTALSLKTSVTLNKQNSNADSTIKPEIITAFANVTKLLQADPILRDSLTTVQLQTLTYYENKYRSDVDFKSKVTKKILEISKGVAPSESKGSTSAEAARDRRRASRDNIQKFLDIIRSMNPQI